MKKTIQNIKIHVRGVQQLFEMKDPSPFYERDLDSSFASYLKDSAYELREAERFNIQIDIDEARTFLSEQQVASAIKAYFSYRIEMKRAEFRRTLRAARVFFFVGILALVTCIMIARGLLLLKSEWINTTLREGFVVFGWVSLWRPFEVFLFDWFPIWEDLKLYRKLSNSEIAVNFQPQKERTLTM